MTLSFLDLLTFSAFIVAITGSIVIASKWRDNSNHLNLAGFILTYGSGALVPVLLHGKVFENHPFWIYFPLDYRIFSLAFLYAFLMGLSGRYDLQKVRWVFLFPTLVVLSQFYFWSSPSEEKLSQLLDGRWGYIFDVYYIITFIFSVILTGVLLWLVNKYVKEVDQYYSIGLPSGFVWVKRACYYLVFWIFVTAIPPSLFPKMIDPSILIFLTAFTIVALMWIIVAGMNPAYKYIPTLQEESDEESDVLISKDRTLINRFAQEIKEKEYFRSVELNLNDLAELLNVSPRKLSKLINNEANMNFRNFINTFRVAYAKKQLDEGVLSEISIYGLAQESGFKSRTTFYAAFKQIIGSTPSVYLMTKQG